MGQSLTVDAHVLLLGKKNQGKTCFMYNNLLQKTSQKNPQQKQGQQQQVAQNETSLGFNYERIESKDYNFGVWDLGGSELFQQNWSTFYKNRKMDATIFMIACHIKFNTNDTPNFQFLNEIYETEFTFSRKLLHLKMNDKYLSNLPLVLIFNEFESNSTDAFTEDIELRYLEELVQFKELPNKAKQSFILSANNYQSEKFNPIWQWLSRIITNEKSKQKSKK